jgi:hypothetical protein
MTVTADLADDGVARGFMAVQALARAGAPPRPPVAPFVPIRSPG